MALGYRSIGLRLKGAMLALLAVLLLSTAIAVHALTRIRDGLERVATDDLTVVRLANELAQDSQSIVAHSPRLALANDEVSLLGVQAFITDQLRQMVTVIVRLEQQGVSPHRIAEFRQRHTEMEQRLALMVSTVRERNNALQALSMRQAGLMALSQQMVRLHEEIHRIEGGGLGHEAAGGLVVDWMVDAGQVMTQTSVLLGTQNTGAAAAVEASLKRSVTAMKTALESVPPSLRPQVQTLHDTLLGLCCQEDGAVALQREALTWQIAVLGAVRAGKQAADDLVAASLSTVGSIEQGVQETRSVVAAQWQRALILFVAGAMISVVAALLTFGFIQRAISNRLFALRDAVRAAEQGGRPTFPVEVRDEIDDIGRAIGFFVNAIEGRETALRQSEEQVRRLIENAPFPLVVADAATGKVHFANDRARGSIVPAGGQDDSVLDPAVIYDVIEDPRERELVRETVQATGSVQGWELRLKGQGSPFWAILSASPVRYRGAGSVLFTVYDVDTLKVAEEQLSKLVRELERSNAELEQFAYAASHDLREPLRMVSGYLTLLARRLAPHMDDESREFVQFAQDGARRMDRLIHDLLEFSRVGRSSTKVAVDLRRVVTAVQDTLSVPIHETGAQIHLPERLPVVMGVESELHRLIQNLLSNALKYRSPERVPHITLTCRQDGELWHFTVTDNGPGIAPEHHERVFVLFQRLGTSEPGTETAGSGGEAGTGIGLALCRKIVESHGGRLWLDSQEGEGASFHFTLPVLSIRGF